MAALLIAAATAAQAFDPEAATRAYLSTLQGAARAKSDAYFEGGYWLLLWGAVVGVVSHWLIRACSDQRKSSGSLMRMSSCGAC